MCMNCAITHRVGKQRLLRHPVRHDAVTVTRDLLLHLYRRLREPRSYAAHDLGHG